MGHARSRDGTVGRHLLLVGGGSVRPESGCWRTRTPIAAYVNELSRGFDSATWLAQVESGRVGFAGEIAPTVRVLPLRPGLAGAPGNCWNALRQARGNLYCMLFLPAAALLLPVVGVLQRASRRTAVYLAGDFEHSLRQGRYRNWPGAVNAYRAGYEVPLRRASLVLARGAYLAEIARRFNPNVVETVPLASLPGNEAFGPPGAQQTGPVRVLYVGKLSWSKGLDVLLESLPHLLSRHDPRGLEVHIVGDGADAAAVRAKAASMEFARSVTFHGWLEAGPLADIFSRAHVVVVPSSSQTEGVPRVIEEAVTRGVPVIATRVGGVSREFPDGEICLVDPRDHLQLAQAIDAVLFDPEVRRRFIEGAQRRAKRWRGKETAAGQHLRLLLDPGTV